MLLFGVFDCSLMASEGFVSKDIEHFLDKRLLGKAEEQKDTFQDHMVFLKAGAFPLDESKFIFESNQFRVLHFVEFDKLPNDRATKEYLYQRIVTIENRFTYNKIFDSSSFDAAIDLVPSPIPYALIYSMRQSYLGKKNARELMLADLKYLVEKYGYTLSACFWEQAALDHEDSVTEKIKNSPLPKTKALKWYLAQPKEKKM